MMALWILALLSLMLAAMQLQISGSLAQARWQQRSAAAEMAAEAGIALVVYDMQRPLAQRRWHGTGDRANVRIDGFAVSVTVQSVRGLVDLNSARIDTLARLVAGCGGNAGLADTILAARKRHPLLLNRQLLELPGASRHAFECLDPYVTVWSGMPMPEAAFAPPRLRALLALPAGGTGTDPGAVLRIHSVAALPGGFKHAVTSTLITDTATTGARPYRLLDWHD